MIDQTSSIFGMCITNGTDYSSICLNEDKICFSTLSKATFCGSLLEMMPIEVFPNI
jgi:hypothetical protein